LLARGAARFASEFWLARGTARFDRIHETRELVGLRSPRGRSP
jgi:hypothetical protein